jgi:soluble lytic murein transglycosylase-like protein
VTPAALLRLIALALAGLFFAVPARASTTADALDLLCGPGHRDLAPHVDASARRHLLHPVVLVSVIAAESTCQADAVNARTGAIGLGQIMPGRSADRPGSNLRDPATNLNLTARHLAGLMVLCGSLGGAVHVYHGHKRCRGWERDRHAVKVVAWVDRFWTEMRRRKEPRT